MVGLLASAGRLVFSMISMHGYRVIYDARSKLDAKLSSVIKGKEWDWLPVRFESLVNIQSKLLIYDTRREVVIFIYD